MRLTWSVMVCAPSWLNNLRKSEPNVPRSVGVWQLFDTDTYPCWCSHLLGVNRFAIGFLLSNYSANPDLRSINSLSISYNVSETQDRPANGTRQHSVSPRDVKHRIEFKKTSKCEQQHLSSSICQNKLKKYVELCVYVTVYVTVSL